MIVGRDKLNGFHSLRTRENVVPDPALFPKKRFCHKCGAVLRPSNTSGTCCPCFGKWEIPAWAQAIVDFDDRPDTVDMIARRLRRNSGYITEATLLRNQQIRGRYLGGASEDELGAEYGLSPRTVLNIVQSKRNRDQCGVGAAE